MKRVKNFLEVYIKSLDKKKGGEIKKESKDFLEFNANEGITLPNLCDTIKSVQRGKYEVLSAFLKKLDRPHTINLSESMKAPE
jgi:hypothetical protein